VTEWRLAVRQRGAVVPVSATDATVTTSGDGTGFWLDVTTGRAELELDHLVIRLPAAVEPGDLAWLSGYQTWSESQVRPLRATRRPLHPVGRLFKLDRYGDAVVAPGQRDPRAECSHEVLAVQNADGAQLWGSRLGFDAYTVIEAGRGELRIVVDVAGRRLEPGRTTRVAWIEHRRGDHAPELLRAWAASVATARPADAITGWTSWYRYYGDIDACRLTGEIDVLAASGVRFDVFQIDDGWQARVGDWTAFAPGFPEGVAPLAASARRAGMRPGLWLAPFVAARNSDIAEQHPDWLLRDDRGHRVPAGWNHGWKGTFYALDLEHPEVIEHLAGVIRTARDVWGFGFFKLDFLYAAALDGRPGATRAQRMRRAMTLLREWCGDATVLACGVPLVSAAGIVEYCRVGADVAARWEDPVQRALHYPERISTVSSLRSSVARAWMDGTWFGNDPDVVILRTDDTRLSDAERRALFAVNTTLGSLVFVSDDIAGYDAATTALLASWDPPGAATVRQHSRAGGVDHLVTDRGALGLALGDGTGRVVG
jgi:alpha-galactosidase